ncbi:MAG TPA: ATP-binding protein [Candidatus Limnocylindria bacterium]|nr:ATP-binding protein [Candidatus Limnocylindria bacterium]
MPSPRTEALLQPLGDLGSLFERLNVRLVLTLASVVMVALLVSGVALSQILPGYFLDEAERRAETAAISTAILIQSVAEQLDITNRAILRTPELRNTQLLQPRAQQAANSLAQGTVEIQYENGPIAAVAPPGPAVSDRLRQQGFAPDPQVPAHTIRAPIPDGLGGNMILLFTVRDVYTNRVATLQRVNGTLFGATLAALAVSLAVGIIAARRLTGPLARLRRVSGRFAAGELDVRAPQFGIVEVDDLGQQFNVMADRLSESLRLLEADRNRLREFVADVSHELRTPIAALRTFTELQRDGEVGESQRREFLDRSTQQINRLEWMSTNLLDLSRIDAGIFPMDVRPGDLREPVRAVVEAHSEQADAAGVSLALQVPAEPVMLRFDRERVVQLLSNLVGNAVKFTQRGGEVVVDLVDRGDEAVLEVRDSGPGIPEQDLPLVFDRFFRGTNVGEARASGSGLGLAIARSIVEMHGGTIGVSSLLGRGATFTVRLPRERAEGQ